MRDDRPVEPADDRRPTHPTFAAALMMAGVVVLLLVLATASALG